ncbi:hypothetical protein [Cupriavidus taiwanensis]|uniref:Uncharacterized protein n=1 Tax=Cupriavidus taiwanensis (strain DSM 17343 / BCRC 17206 / CCUG 44338 / CIP 107171 / LMG 19424 / R1) TaxID=977880 RepID=B3R9N0_CUPTR|nr:hypothetical protein [Cupriavidus taiwanensis]CAQ71605.1 hypothetical protein RALTA_B0994 [Cupriavidus taiwanensis LMG 19424]
MDWIKFGPRPQHKYAAGELRELYQACPTPQMRQALWEIKRLQTIVKKANQLGRALSGMGYQEADLALLGLMQMLKDEPCIHEDPTRSIVEAMERDKE